MTGTGSIGGMLGSVVSFGYLGEALKTTQKTLLPKKGKKKKTMWW